MSRLVILGSAGGPLPRATRNSASHALVLGERTQIIDCGNGVGAQLVRAGVALASLRRIFITHHHIDHVADFGMLVHLSWSQLREPVEIIGPPPIARMLELYLELYSLDIRWRVQDEKRRELRELLRVREISEPGEILREPGLTVSCTLVDHPPVDRVFAYRFDSDEGSVVFSGDTVPCDRLVALARGADVLVHEALYLDDAERYLSAERAPIMIERMLRAHTKAEDAGRIAQRAGVRTLVLSPVGAFAPVDQQRLMARTAQHFGGEILVGRDLLEVALPLPHV